MNEPPEQPIEAFPDNAATTHFGFRDVPLRAKQAMVDDVFHSVANRYDLMNDLMSGGLHRAWKGALVTAVNPPKSRRLRAARSRRRHRRRGVPGAGGRRRAPPAPPWSTSTPTCSTSGARAPPRAGSTAVTFVEGNAEALPFADRSFDAVTIAFGIRNVPRIEAALREAHRVLAIGGRFLCLEFSTVDVPGLDALYDFYSFNVIPALGRAVTGDAEAYRYLVESIRRFPPPESFAELMRAAGLARVSFRPLTGGIVALHSGWRL